MWIKLNCAFDGRAAGDWMRVSEGVALELASAGNAEAPGLPSAELAASLLQRIESRCASAGGDWWDDDEDIQPI